MWNQNLGMRYAMGKTLLETLAQSLKEFKAIVKGKASAKFGRALVERMRGRATVRMTTDEIMALTRGK